MTLVETPLDVVKRFTSNFEKKQRNLYKRKCKLDQYREKLNRGESLNEEQKKAVEGYDAVIHSIAIIQETLNQSKELADEVSKASENVERQREAEEEASIVSYLCVHNSLMRFLDSLESPDVRSAVLKASSENQLKMLDAVRISVKCPIVTDLSVSTSFVSVLQENAHAHETSQHGYDFVTGRPSIIPIPPDYEGSHKKFNFKEARNLCFRLLSTPTVIRSLGCDIRSSICVCDESTEPVQERAPSVIDDVNTHSPCLNEPMESTTCSTNLDHIPLNQPGEGLDAVIKPLGGTFKFLQASNVISISDQGETKQSCMAPPELPVAASYTEPQNDSQQEMQHQHFEEDHNRERQTTSPTLSRHVDSYSRPPQDQPVANHPAPPQPMTQHPVHHVEETDGYVMVEPARPSKPMSYAELVRRPWGHQHDHAVQQPMKRQVVPADNPHQQVIPQSDEMIEHYHDYQQSQQQQGPFHKNPDRDYTPNYPTRGGGGRGGGFRPPFSRGGAPRRPMGNFRGNRFGGGGTSGRGAYRGVPPGVAQPSY